jgi:hypothetical protein
LEKEVIGYIGRKAREEEDGVLLMLKGPSEILSVTSLQQRTAYNNRLKPKTNIEKRGIYSLTKEIVVPLVHLSSVELCAIILMSSCCHPDDPNMTFESCDLSFEEDSVCPLGVGNSSEETCGPFYDHNSTLQVPFDIAKGYFILMTGGELKVPELSKQKKAAAKRATKGIYMMPGGIASIVQRISKEKKGEEGVVSFEVSFDGGSFDELPGHLWIAWHALTDGNVIDSCFGVKAHGGNRIFRGKGETPEVVMVKNAKAQLISASESHKELMLLAIEAYGRCFEIVMEYQQELERLGVVGCLLCPRRMEITNRATKNLNEAFEYLIGAVEAVL